MRARSESPVPLGHSPLLLILLLLTGGGGLLIAQVDPGISLGVSLLFLLLFLSFLNTELALHIILLSMLLSPEIVVGGIGMISIGKPESKGDLLVLRMEDLILLVVTLAWVAKGAIFKELGLARKSPLNSSIFSYVFCLVFSTLLGLFLGNVRPARGFFFTLKYIEYFVVYFMTLNCIQRKEQLRRLLITAFATCATAAIIGILQIPSGERVAAPFEGKLGEPNTFGGYLVFMLAVVLGLALTANGIPAQLGWYTFACLISLPLLYTLSRTSWMAAIPMVMTLIILSPRRLLLIVGVGVVFILGSTVFPKQVVERYNYTFHAKESRGEFGIGDTRFDSSTGARLESWIYGFRGWTKRPLFGYGVTGFSFMDAQYFRVLVEAGLAGLICFLWLLWRILQTAWNTYQGARNTPFEGIALGYLAGLVAMAAHGFGANTFIIVRIMEPFWFFTAVIALLPLIRKSSTLRQSNPASAVA